MSAYRASMSMNTLYTQVGAPATLSCGLTLIQQYIGGFSDMGRGECVRVWSMELYCRLHHSRALNSGVGGWKMGR